MEVVEDLHIKELEELYGLRCINVKGLEQDYNSLTSCLRRDGISKAEVEFEQDINDIYLSSEYFA